MTKETYISIKENELKEIIKDKLNLNTDKFDINLEMGNTYDQEGNLTGQEVKGLEILIKENI